MSDTKGLLGGVQALQMLPMQRLQKNLEGVQSLAKAVEGRKPMQHTELEKAATQFEALLVGEMVKSMWATVPSEGILSGSNEEEMYRDMFNDALAQNIAEGPGLGIKRVVMEDMQRLEDRGNGRKD
jgi:flagellar protein FlgJ